MEYANYAITLDVQAAGSGVLLEARQGDTGRRIAITLTDGGRPYRLTEDCYCVFTGLKPDGHTVIHACQNVGSTVFYTLREQTLAAQGTVKCELRIYGGEGMLLTSAAFGLLVEGTVYTRAENIESENEYTALSDLLEKAQTLRQELLELKTQLEALGDRLETGGGSTGGGGTPGAPGKDGKDGVTFTPSVDTEGNLSWSNDGGLSNPATVNIKGEKGEDGAAASLGIIIPQCPAYPVWLCDSSTDAYQTTIGQNSATCSLSYADFLSQYFDCYITSHEDRYSVTKKSLGRDSANRYDVFEYTFTPKRYSRTVMLSGGMNACELPAEFGIAYFIKNVMEKTDSSFAWLHDNVRFKIIPVICPWSFDQSPMVYENFNGVNLNKNFDYNHCWEDYSAGGAGTKGDAPCSEAETKLLLRWINANANNCDLWIDCHTDSAGIAEDETAYLHCVICSDSATTNLIAVTQSKITQAYIAAGFFDSGAEKTGIGTWTEKGTNYPKTLYARHICGIPSIMIEQYVGNPYYGGTKSLANTSADINNYVTMLRAYVLAVLEREAITLTGADFGWYIYQSMMANHCIADDTGPEEPDVPDVPDVPDEPVTPAGSMFTHGGIGGDGSFNTNTARAHSKLIEVPESGVFTVTNMSGYVLVDVGVYEADGTTFRELTTYYTKTETGNDWVFTMDRFTTYYPTGKYVRFSIKRTDNGTIDLADLADCEPVITETPDEPDEPVTPTDSLFTHGGMNGDGTFGTQIYRAHSDFIECTSGSVITVTNMGNYEVVDVGVYEADKTTFRELTYNMQVTSEHSGNDLILTASDGFSAVYPTGKYIVFSVKRTDEPYGTIDLADFADCEITVE